MYQFLIIAYLVTMEINFDMQKSKMMKNLLQFSSLLINDIVNRLVSIRSTYMLLKCVIQVLQHASILISNETIHKKMFPNDGTFRPVT